MTSLMTSLGLFAVIGCLVSLVCGSSTQPDFAVPLNNVSVALGRDATFACVVTQLGGYRVGWVKADTKAIQAIHNHVITHNSRVHVTHSDRNTWLLHIRGVQEEDRGPYMCQINTDPMRSQIGHLEVTVPPEIVDEDSSGGDVMVPEGGTASLRCRARGHPPPVVVWQREDQQQIAVRSSTNNPAMGRTRSPTYQGEVLHMTQVTRSDMGPYLCIANNSVPPIVSKRIMLEVHFPPVIHVPNQLISAREGASLVLECNVEASPKSIQYWTNEQGEMLISNDEFKVVEALSNYYNTKMSLTIHPFLPRHEGRYHCTAKNSLGDITSQINVYMVKPETEPPPPSTAEDFSSSTTNQQFQNSKRRTNSKTRYSTNAHQYNGNPYRNNVYDVDGTGSVDNANSLDRFEDWSTTRYSSNQNPITSSGVGRSAKPTRGPRYFLPSDASSGNSVHSRRTYGARGHVERASWFSSISLKKSLFPLKLFGALGVPQGAVLNLIELCGTSFKQLLSIGFIALVLHHLFPWLIKNQTALCNLIFTSKGSFIFISCLVSIAYFIRLTMEALKSPDALTFLT